MLKFANYRFPEQKPVDNSESRSYFEIFPEA